jgi:hypothetical protein
MKLCGVFLAVLALLFGSPVRAQAGMIDYAWSGYNLPTGQFGTLDLQTGVFTQTGTLPGGIVGGDMARLPGGPLFAVDTSSNLILINPVNASVTLLGHSGNNIEALAIRQDGTLFGLSYQNLYRIDTTTGAATLVGQMGNFVPPVSFDATFDSAGNLFLVEQNGASTSSLYKVNASTGLATLVGSTGFSVTGLDYEGGTLYGFTLDGKLISINTQTGVGTFLVNESGANNYISVGATADPGAAAAPEPSTLVLLGIGAAGVAWYGRRWRRPGHRLHAGQPGAN